MAHAHVHSSTVMWGALSSLSPLRRRVKLGWRACCGFASVHRLPRHAVIDRALSFGYGSTGDAGWHVWFLKRVLEGGAQVSRGVCMTGSPGSSRGCAADQRSNPSSSVGRVLRRC
jgi:hypothetical protein